MNEAKLTTKERTLSPQKTLELGYQALVDQLGPVGAAQFMMHAFSGEGDSVKYYRAWRDQDQSINEISEEIDQAKKAGLI